MRMYDVVALGELLIDFVHQGNNDVGYPLMQGNPGGAPGNFLSTLSKFGAKTGFLGKVGSDRFGRMLVKTFRDAGVETKGILVDDRYFTTLAFVTLDDSGDREFSFARKPGADTMLTIDELPKDLVTETKVFHFGTLSMTGEPARSTTKEAVRMAKEAGAMITFDPNLRRPLWSSMELAREQMLWGLRHADVVKIGQDELEFIFEGQDFKDSAKKLVEDFGVKLVFATMGKEGCYFINRQGSGQVPTFQEVKTIDTTGAGDIFGGSAVYQVFASGVARSSFPRKGLRKSSGLPTPRHPCPPQSTAASPASLPRKKWRRFSAAACDKNKNSLGRCGAARELLRFSCYFSLRDIRR